MDDTTRRLPDHQRLLGSYELQLRNLLGVQRHAQLIVEQLQGRRGLTEPIAELLSHIENSDMDAWIASVQAALVPGVTTTDLTVVLMQRRKVEI